MFESTYHPEVSTGQGERITFLPCPAQGRARQGRVQGRAG